MAKATLKASGEKRKRPSPVRKITGESTTTVVIVETITGIATSSAASRAAVSAGFPIRKCRTVFSRTTMESSTSLPTARARPPSVMLFNVFPVAYKPIKAARMESGIVRPTTTV